MPKAKTSTAQAPTPTAGAVTSGAAASAPITPMGFAGAPPGAPPPVIPSFDPDQAVSVGRANNFNGRVISLLATPWLVEKDIKGKGKIKLYELSAELKILADDHSLGQDGIVTEYLKMDQLSQFVPSRVDPYWNPQTNQWVYTPAGTVGGQPATLETYLALANGQNGFPSSEMDPATGQPKWAHTPPEDWKGFFVIPGPACARTGLMKGTKFQHFTSELKRLGYRTMAPHINWADFRQFLVGVYGTWVRLPFTFTGGTAPAGSEKGGSIETLCLTQVLDLGPISGAGGPQQPQAGNPVSVAAVPVTPAPVVATPAPIPAAVPAAQPIVAGGVTTGLTLEAENPEVSQAANEILTALVAAKGQVGIQEAGNHLYETLNQRGLNGGKGLILINSRDDAGWMVGDNRTFAFDQAKAILLPLS